MNKEQILEVIKSLAKSQGFYGRLYEELTNGSKESEAGLDLLEAQNFKDNIELILFIEG